MQRHAFLVLLTGLLCGASPVPAQDTTSVSDQQLRQHLDTSLSDARKSIEELSRLLTRMETLRAAVHTRITRDSLTARPPVAQPPGAGGPDVETPDPGPSDGGLLHADDFERDEVEAKRGAFRWTGPARVGTSTERARSGKRALKFRFGAMSTTPVTEQSRAQLNFAFPPSGEVWLEWYAWYPDGKEGIPGVGAYEHGADTPDNNKILRIYAAGHYSKSPEWGASASAEVRGQGGGSKLRLDYFPADGPDNWAPKRRADQPILIDLTRDRGRWVQHRFYARKATPGRSDGIIRFWKDGRLLSEAAGLALSDPTGKHDHFSAGYLYGAANSGFPRETAVYVDDFKIYRSSPGW